MVATEADEERVAEAMAGCDRVGSRGERAGGGGDLR